MTVQLADARFEELVVEALDEIPEPFASMLSNVEIVIEPEPTAEQLAGLDGPDDLLGLYEGIPQTERGDNYTFVMPDKITIFRGPILRICDDEDDVYDEVAITVVHEVAHHFGIDDARLEELGW
ncbi:MAG: metallopeptidase family protein [Actinomycetota bacterium]